MISTARGFMGVVGNNFIQPLKPRFRYDSRHLAEHVCLVKLLVSACPEPVEVAATFDAGKRRAATPTPGPEPEDQAASISSSRSRPLGLPFVGLESVDASDSTRSA